MAADDAIEPPLIVVGTFSFSLDEIDIAAALGFLAAGLPLPLSVIDVKGPGMSSLPWLLLLDLDGVKYRGTGTCTASVGDWVLAGDGVPFPIFTLSGTTGVVGASGFAFGGFGNLFACISGVGAFGFPRADLDLGALGGGR